MSERIELGEGGWVIFEDAFVEIGNGTCEPIVLSHYQHSNLIKIKVPVAEPQSEPALLQGEIENDCWLRNKYGTLLHVKYQDCYSKKWWIEFRGYESEDWIRDNCRWDDGTETGCYEKPQRSE